MISLTNKKELEKNKENTPNLAQNKKEDTKLKQKEKTVLKEDTLKDTTSWDD